MDDIKRCPYNEGDDVVLLLILKKHMLVGTHAMCIIVELIYS